MSLKLAFGAFVIDEGARRLWRGQRSLHLSPKAFDLLVLLARRRPEAISKQDLQDRLWPDTFVSDGNLAVLIAEIRTALGENARSARLIRTVHRVGYAFAGQVTEAPAQDELPALAAARCWLTWRKQRMPLRPGENLLGRDVSAHVRIDALGVSRRHAVVTVTEDEAVLRDLGSKNGTYLNDFKVSAPTALTNGAEIRLGLVGVVFRQAPGVTSTQTLPQPRQRRIRRE